MNKNVIKTFVFMAFLSAVLLWAGTLFKDNGGIVIMAVVVAMLNFGAFFFSDKLVVKMTRSRPVTEQEAPWFYRIVRSLTQKSGMPMPKLYVMPASQPNAFATGRSPRRAVVAVTEGILNVLDEKELEGVLAHELAHVRNRDVLIGAVAAMVAAAVTFIARIAMWGALLGGGGDDDDSPLGAIGTLLFIVLAPIAAFLIQMAVSRSRESQADRTGAELLGDATPLANALIKIDAAARNTPVPAISPAVAHVFLQNPLRGVKVAKWFMSHPPLEERIAQLRELGARV